MLDVENWPDAPIEDRPKPLYVADRLSDEDTKHLSDKGWRVVDVRTLPNKTDADRQFAIKARLEGASRGSITMTRIELDALELEARAAGLLRQKEQTNAPTETAKLDKDNLDLILSFQSRRAFEGAFRNYDDFLERVTTHVKKRAKKW